MGFFRDIVRSRRGPQGRINEFKLGLTVSPPRRTGLAPYPILFTCSEKVSEPMVSSYRMQFSEKVFLEVKREVDDSTRISIPDYTTKVNFPFLLPSELLYELADRGEVIWDSDGESGRIKPIIRFIRGLFRNTDTPTQTTRRVRRFRLESIISPIPKMVAIAPLRSKPKRTYNPVRERASSEGEHVPMLMMRLDRTERDEWDELHNRLVTFGREVRSLFRTSRSSATADRSATPFNCRSR